MNNPSVDNTAPYFSYWSNVYGIVVINAGDATVVSACGSPPAADCTLFVAVHGGDAAPEFSPDATSLYILLAYTTSLRLLESQAITTSVIYYGERRDGS